MKAKKLKSVGISRLALVLSLAALGSTGCTTRLVDYTLLSTKNVDLSKASTYKRGANRVTAEDSQFIIIFIPTASAPHLKEAVDRAIESVPGAIALVDGVVSARGWWFILGENAIVVEGTPLIDPALPGASASLEGKYLVSFPSPKSRQQSLKSVDEPTFLKVKELVRQGDNEGVNKMLKTLL